MLKPKVHITHLEGTSKIKSPEFLIPGGVFVSDGHCWAKINEEGTVQIGIDDFANKLIGNIDAFEFPAIGNTILKGQPLFSIKQGNRSIKFNSPVS